MTAPLFTFAVATAIASGCYWLGQSVSLVGANLHGIIALVFLYAPAVCARVEGGHFDYREAGLRTDPLASNVRTLAVAVLCSLPLFLLGFLVFYEVTCTHRGVGLLGSLSEIFAPVCGHWKGLPQASLVWPDNFLMLALSQVIAVALPEELFFRGYLLGRLEARFPSRRVLWGAPVGRALLVCSALFAVGHVLVDFDPQRLAVFFPALIFGWMRARTGSLLPGAVFHALCNLFSDVLYTSFFS